MNGVYKMIVIFVGASASGKTVISRNLVENYNYKEITSYTTRDKRPGEKNGIDYHFVSNKDFANMIFAEEFAEWERYPGDRWYGTAVKDVKEAAKSENIYAMVLTPSGMRRIKSIVGEENVYTILVKCELGERVKRYIDRCKDKFSLADLEEINNRAQRDFGMLMGVENEVDYIVENTNCNLQDLTYSVFNEVSKFQQSQIKIEEEQER